MKSKATSFQRIEYYIGIDPDVSKNGFSVVSSSGCVVDVGCLPFAELIDYIVLFAMSHSNVLVCIEGGWLHRTNWHTSGASIAMAARIGNAAGRNHQTGILLNEVLTYRGIRTKVVKPLRKYWRGTDRKITHQEIAKITRIERKATNQEERDALLLAWVCAGLPLRIT